MRVSKYCEVTSKSLIDFEEIKFILANNNVNLVKAHQLNGKVYLKDTVSVLNSNYKTIIDNSLTMYVINGKKYLCYITEDGYYKNTTSIEIVDENECIEFLNHIGFNEQFSLDADYYVYSDGVNMLNIINLINIGLYISVRKENATFEEVKEILESFNIPHIEEVLDESIEKLVVNKLRRQMK